MVDLPDQLARKPKGALSLSHQEMHNGNLVPETVILVQDWFTALFDPDLQQDVVNGLRALGFSPRLLPMRPAGKAAQTLGDMPSFRKMASALMKHLELAAQTGRPIVGMDPAFVMQLRQDYPTAGFHPPQVLLPQEFLAEAIRTKQVVLPKSSGQKVHVLSHCTETTGKPHAPDLWRQVFEGLDIAFEAAPAGCCGMAGLFGHQKRHQRISRKLFDMSWRSHVEDDIEVAATGFSCRCQSDRLSKRRIRYPLGIVADLVMP